MEWIPWCSWLHWLNWRIVFFKKVFITTQTLENHFPPCCFSVKILHIGNQCDNLLHFFFNKLKCFPCLILIGFCFNLLLNNFDSLIYTINIFIEIFRSYSIFHLFLNVILHVSKLSDKTSNQFRINIFLIVKLSVMSIKLNTIRNLWNVCFDFINAWFKAFNFVFMNPTILMNFI